MDLSWVEFTGTNRFTSEEVAIFDILELLEVIRCEVFGTIGLIYFCLFDKKPFCKCKEIKKSM